MSEWGPHAIGAWIDEYEQFARAQREEEQAEVPLAGYAALLKYAHPPQECGDPMDCEAHRQMYLDYHAPKPAMHRITEEQT